MVNIIIIGMMGTGKTTFVKSYIKNRKCLIFDVNNEYKELSTDNRKPVSRVIDLDHKKYIGLTLQKRNTVCVFEDATGFIQGRLSDSFVKSLISKRHTGNVNILIFHSVSSVPPRLLQLTNYVVLFNTGDEDYQVYKKYPSLFNQWKQVKELSIKNEHASKVIKIM